MTDYTETDEGRVEATNSPKAATDGLDLVGPREAFFAERNNGELVPKKIPVPGRDVKVEVLPAPSGVYNEFLDDVPWGDNEAMARLFRKQFPGLDNLTAEELERDLLSFSAQTMVNLIRKASGEDMQRALEGEQMQAQMEGMADALGIDTSDADLSDLLEMGGGTTSGGVREAAQQAGVDPSEATVEELAAALEETEQSGQAAMGAPNVSA